MLVSVCVLACGAVWCVCAVTCELCGMCVCADERCRDGECVIMIGIYLAT